MKKKAYLAMIVLLSMIIFAGCSSSSSVFGVETGDDNVVTITAETADDGASATGNIVIAEGQKMQCQSELSEEGTIRLDVYPGNLGMDEIEDGEVFMSIMLSGNNSQEIELEAGEYTILAEVEGTVTGTATLKAN